MLIGKVRSSEAHGAERQPSFDPKSFLAVVGEGRSIGEYRKDQIVFSQGDPADAVFYIQRGKVKVSVVSEQGKEAVVAMLGTNDFFGGRMSCRAGAATLADMIGTTRSRVSFFMNKFRKLGLIDYNGSIEVHSSLLNVVLHDEPHIEI